MANEIMSVEGQLVGLPLAGPESFSQQQLDYLKRALGVDETVLWSGTPASTMVLSETLTDFERIRFKIYIGQGYQFCECEVKDQETDLCIHLAHGYSNAWNTQLLLAWNEANLTLTVSHSKSIATSFTTSSTSLSGEVDTHKACIYEIVGIHRIAGGN